MREESKNYHQYSTVGFDMNISVSFDWPHEDFPCMHIRTYTVWMVAPVYLGGQLPVGIGTTYLLGRCVLHCSGSDLALVTLVPEICSM